MAGNVEAGGQRTLCGPAPQSPVVTALGKTHAVETGNLARSQPVILYRHICFTLFQPVHVHGQALDAAKVPTSWDPKSLGSGFSNSFSPPIPRSIARMR